MKDILYKVQWGSFLITSIVYTIIVIMTSGEASSRYRDHTFPFIDQKSMYPHLVQETVDYWTMILTFEPSVIICIGLVEYFATSKTIPTLTKTITFLNFSLASLECTFLTVASTRLIKVDVGFLRPDFSDRCFGTTNITELENLPTQATCKDLDEREIRDGKKAFPSGHTSSASSFGFYVSFYLLYCIYVRADEHYRWMENADKKRRKRVLGMIKPFLFCLALLPIAAGIAISLTRITDFRHSPADVVAGIAIGAFFGTFTIFRTILHENSTQG